MYGFFVTALAETEVVTSLEAKQGFVTSLEAKRGSVTLGFL
jgi:hypothetical protein